MLSIASNLATYDDNRLLDDLVFAFVSISIEDWNDSTADAFTKAISDSIAKINEYIETKIKVTLFFLLR